ncbi:MAG: PAS domain S-box protein [Pseudomonadota bacterium]
MRKGADSTEELATRQELGRLKKIFDATPDVVATLRPDLRFMDLNDSGRKLMGWPLDQDLSEKTLSAFFTSREYDRIVNQGIPAAVETGTWKDESTLVPVEGSEVPVTIAILAHKSEHGELEFLTLVARALVEIKSTMERLEASEQRLLLSQKIAEIGTWEINYKNDHIYVSDETCRIFEVDPEKFNWTYRSAMDMVHPKDRERVHQVYQDCVQNQSDYRLEHRLLLRNGKIKHVKAVGIMETDESGSVIRSIGTIQDVTALSLLQQDLLVKSRAIENHIDAIAMSGLDGNLVYVNQAFNDLWGEKRKEDVLGRSAISFWEDADEALGVIKELRSEGFWVGEMKAKRRDGSTFYTLLSASVIRNPEYETSFLMASFVDITDRKKVEALLKEAERKYRLLVESQEDLICRWLPDSTLTFVNQSYCRFFGRTCDQLIGRQWLTFIPEGAQDGIRRYCQDLERNQRISRIEHQAISSDGNPYWQEWIDTPLFDSQGRLQEIQSVGRDITYRRKLEEKIRNNSELFNIILNTTSEAYWYVGTDRRILDVNENACAMLGYTREEMLNLTVSDIDAVESEEETKRHMEEFIKTGYSMFETKHRKKDGSIIDVEVRATAWISGKSIMIASFLRDITEEKILLENKKKMEVIQRSNEVKKKLLGSFRHELLTPMNAVLGFSRILSNDPELADPHREKAEIVNQGASRLFRALNNIFSMADIEASGVEIDNEAFDLIELLEEVAQSFLPLSKAKGLGMTVEIDQRHSWSVFGDRPKLRLALENLLEYSLQFTDQGGVSLRVWKEVAAGGVLDDGAPARIMFEFEAGSAGVAEDLQIGLFDPLAHNAGSSIPDRLGFGLVIAREYVRKMGGDIRIESRAGKRSLYCFDVQLQCIPGDKGDVSRGRRIQITAGYAQPIHGSDLSATETASDLPEELRAKLRQAVEEGDMDLFTELLGQAAESHPESVRTLRHLADVFDYPRLNALLAAKGGGAG